MRFPAGSCEQCVAEVMAWGRVLVENDQLVLSGDILDVVYRNQQQPSSDAANGDFKLFGPVDARAKADALDDTDRAAVRRLDEKAIAARQPVVAVRRQRRTHRNHAPARRVA